MNVEKLYHLHKIQNISTEEIYQTVLDEVSKIKNGNENSLVNLFAEGFVNNFNESNNYTLMMIKSKGIDAKFFTRTMVLYKVIKFFRVENIGSFISNMHVYFGLFRQNNETIAALAKFMTMDENDADLLFISKIFSLNDFSALADDPILAIYQTFNKCFEHMFNVKKALKGIYTQSSPCLDLNENSKCREFCEWHNEIINNTLQKQELLTLMR